MFEDNVLTPEVIELPPPSYIKELTSHNEGNILLIYRKIEPKIDESSPDKSEDANSSLDLTGNPLKVDLSTGDCTLNITLQDQVNLWETEESCYDGLDLSTIRRCINSQLLINKSGLSVYGLCNGKNKDKIIIQGAKQTKTNLVRYQVFVLGYCGVNEGVERLKLLKNEHINDSGMVNLKKTEILIKSTYNLYGHKLNLNTSSLKSHFSGSIICNVNWTSFDYNIPDYIDSFNMKIQTIIGHDKSQLNRYFKELNHLKLLINHSAKENDDIINVTLNELPKDPSEILSSFETRFSQHNWPQVQIENNLDFNNLRTNDGYVTDLLWNLLTQCETVQDIKFCFESLFYDFSYSKYTIYRVHFSEFESSTISKILIEISNGNLAVPTLTAVQCLILLIECGIEKLKRDYSYILINSDCLSRNDIEKFWDLSKSTDNEKDVEIKDSKSMMMTSSRLTSKSIYSGVQFGRTRRNTNVNELILNFNEALRKYTRLTSMHVACDILALSLNYMTYSNLNEIIHFKLLNGEIKYSSSKPLFEVECKLDSRFIKYMNLEEPVNLNIKFTSTGKREIVETVFYQSVNKLFPPTLFDDYEPTDGDQPHYFVTKMVTYNTKLN